MRNSKNRKVFCLLTVLCMLLFFAPRVSVTAEAKTGRLNNSTSTAVIKNENGVAKTVPAQLGPITAEKGNGKAALAVTGTGITVPDTGEQQGGTWIPALIVMVIAALAVVGILIARKVRTKK